MWERQLALRIRIQKLMNACNELPRGGDWHTTVAECTDAAVVHALRAGGWR
jgi:hypothetical protein